MAEKRKSSVPPRDHEVEQNGELTEYSDRDAMELKKREETDQQSGSHAWVLLTCFLGIFVSYLIYGVLQETISKRDFNGEKFHYFMFLVCFQCLINATVAKGVSWYRGQRVSVEPYGLFAAGSFSYVCAMVASNSSLAYINYPTQVLGKSVKPIPVLLLGVLLGGRTYPLIKYLCVLLIVFGVGIFLYKDHTPHKAQQKAEDEYFKIYDTIGIGEILLFVSLLLDGITGVMQDKLKMYKISGLHMMYAMNVYAPMYLTVGLLISGEGALALGFLSRHPHVLINILLFSMASAVGQIFIFTTITTFGPLTCSIITTTRKFFTILGSVVLFGNSLLQRQWAGVVLVFIGLSLDVYFEKGRKKKNGPTQTA